MTAFGTEASGKNFNTNYAGVAQAQGAVEPLALSIDDVCKVTSSGRTAVYAAIKNGDLKAKKLGRRTVILAADLRDWLASLPALGAQNAA